jgi:hypothetical protein
MLVDLHFPAVRRCDPNLKPSHRRLTEPVLTRFFPHAGQAQWRWIGQLQSKVLLVSCAKEYDNIPSPGLAVSIIP